MDIAEFTRIVRGEMTTLPSRWSAHMGTPTQRSGAAASIPSQPRFFHPIRRTTAQHQMRRRDQMAAFRVRALGYADEDGGDLFTDDDDSIFETDIDKLATAGVTLECNPPVNDQFCPDKAVTRSQMAAFLHLALGT